MNPRCSVCCQPAGSAYWLFNFNAFDVKDALNRGSYGLLTQKPRPAPSALLALVKSR